LPQGQTGRAADDRAYKGTGEAEECETCGAYIFRALDCGVPTYGAPSHFIRNLALRCLQSGNSQLGKKKVVETVREPSSRAAAVAGLVATR
jgi:hypothetical protein